MSNHTYLPVLIGVLVVFVVVLYPVTDVLKGTSARKTLNSSITKLSICELGLWGYNLGPWRWRIYVGLLTLLGISFRLDRV